MEIIEEYISQRPHWENSKGVRILSSWGVLFSFECRNHKHHIFLYDISSELGIISIGIDRTGKPFAERSIDALESLAIKELLGFDIKATN